MAGRNSKSTDLSWATETRSESVDMRKLLDMLEPLLTRLSNTLDRLVAYLEEDYGADSQPDSECEDETDMDELSGSEDEADSTPGTPRKG